jgi:Wiskott-Aldrich syndrome protein
MTVRGIQQAALAFVRRQAASFAAANVPVPPPPAYGGALALAGLKAAVKAVVVEGVAYDLSGYAGEDLGRVVASLGSGSSSSGGKAGGVPVFEVEVWNVGVSGHGNGEGVVGVGAVNVPLRPGPGGGVSPQGVVQVNGVGVGPRMVFPPPPGVLSN